MAAGFPGEIKQDIRYQVNCQEANRKNTYKAQYAELDS
jgi:hypothetical protein